MNIEVFSLCDAAADYSGKLSLLGTYDAIFASSFPAKVHALVYAIRIRLRRDEGGSHEIKINTIDYDGRHVLAPFVAMLNANLPEGHDSMAFNVIVTSGNVVFPRPGTHRADLLIDNQVLASIPLSIRGVGHSS